ncbi:protein kinase PVPK-1-like isoform X6 [Zootermopsis nevadensis]|uniref:Ribosomal protein S6 kinase alpha-4 n=1 Tax=Zootermopsis nevadensis TaxID=136037 RepID=A0A067R1W6_ZOONE|nr:protein kinase PVPK-1-like isoform X6 [Zootermopsis nevadensis]KDR16842.1 Ribosomal protein S6 kinase alpha-4 [Zootermopsis nevadensis]
MEDIKQRSQLILCRLTKYTINNLRDDLTAAQQRLENADQLPVQKNTLFVILKKFARVEKELESFRERVNEANATKFDIQKMKDKMMDVEGKHRREIRRAQETINGLSEAVARISAENEKFKQQIDNLLASHNDDVIVYTHEEAVGHLSAANNNNIKNKQKRGRTDSLTAQKAEDGQDIGEDCSENCAESSCEDCAKGCCEDWAENCCEDFAKDCCEDCAKGCCEDWADNCAKGCCKDCCEDFAKDCCEDCAKGCCEDWAEKNGQNRARNVPLGDEPPAHTCKQAKVLNSPVKRSKSCLPRLRDFEPLKLLGRGGFGKVYLVCKKGGADNGKLYAMKTMNIEKIQEQKDGCQQYRTECDMYKRGLEAPFLVGLYYAFHTQSKVCLIQDYYAGGDLFHLLREWGVFSVDDTRLYLAEIIHGVEYLHQLRVIHRDIKPANILVDAEGHIAIADYGLCKQFVSSKEDDDYAYNKCGTNQYMAPEMIIGEGYSYEVDWWSVGITAFEMMMGHKPFHYDDDRNHSALYHNILHHTPDIPPWFLDNEVDFLRRILEKDPKIRLGGGKAGAENIKKHPFFDGINWNEVSRRQLVMPHLLDLEHEEDISDQDFGSSNISFLSPSNICDNSNEACSYIAPVLMPNGSN